MGKLIIGRTYMVVMVVGFAAFGVVAGFVVLAGLAVVIIVVVVVHCKTSSYTGL